MIEMLKRSLHERDAVLVYWTAESSVAQSGPVEFPDEGIIGIKKSFAERSLNFMTSWGPSFKKMKRCSIPVWLNLFMADPTRDFDATMTWEKVWEEGLVPPQPQRWEEVRETLVEKTLLMFVARNLGYVLPHRSKCRDVWKSSKV